jgi:Tfp pilus assembly protein PilF
MDAYFQKATLYLKSHDPDNALQTLKIALKISK